MGNRWKWTAIVLCMAWLAAEAVGAGEGVPDLVPMPKIYQQTGGVFALDERPVFIEKGNRQCEIAAEKGRGYRTAEENEKEGLEIGRIPIDSIFTPVLRVRSKAEDTRVGQRTNYDRLVLEIWTDGTLTPEIALVESAKILRKHLNPFVQQFELGRELEEPEAAGSLAPTRPMLAEDLSARLALPIGELELSVRASHCLEGEGIRNVGDLVALDEEKLLLVRNFGRTSLDEVKRKLGELGLTLGMKVEGAPRELPKKEET